MASVRRDPAPLSHDDVGRAARVLARLPDLGHGALAALAWATVNAWRAIHADEDGVKFSLLRAVETLLEHCDADSLLRPRAMVATKWRAVSAMAAALAREGSDPSGGAILFHHGSKAPDWALDRDDPNWIGKWAFYPP